MRRVWIRSGHRQEFKITRSMASEAKDFVARVAPVGFAISKVLGLEGSVKDASLIKGEASG